MIKESRRADEYTLIYDKRQQKDDNKNHFFFMSGCVTQRAEVGQRQWKDQYGASSKSCFYCWTPDHLIAECRRLKAKEANQSRDCIIPEATFKCCKPSNAIGSVEVAVPSGFKCFSDIGILFKFRLSPDVDVCGAAVADFAMTSVVNSSSVDATFYKSSNPRSVTLFRDMSAEQPL